MATRKGLDKLIKKIRSMTNAGTADYSVAGHEYWSDDDLQEKLDEHRVTVVREQLQQVVLHDDTNTARYHDYFFNQKDVETLESGTISWELENSAGSVIANTLYTVDYEAGHIRFTADQAGTIYFLNYRSYPANRVAAQIWREKAGHFAESFDVKTDNHTLTRSQLIQHCLIMARNYESADGRSRLMRRFDVNINRGI